MLQHSAQLKSLQYPPLDITGTLNPAQLIAELIERAADSPDSAGHGENPDSYFATVGGVQGYFIPGECGCLDEKIDLTLLLVPSDVRTAVDEHGVYHSLAMDKC